MSDFDKEWEEKVREYTGLLKKFASSGGHTLNPDADFLKMIVEGLLRNQERLGYASCPCRVADGDFELDFDITCPCVYRDPDLLEYGRCLCSLYVNEDYLSGRKGQDPIPDRRKIKKMSR